jgi:RNA polymerase sigma-70 factor, ECF subfamily
MHRTANDTALIERLQTGDQSAVADLASQYGSKIFQLALRHMKNREDAEEVAQDVLLKVFRKIKAFRGDAALSSWIYRITFNTAMSRLRTVRFSRPAEVSEGDLHPDMESGASRRNDPADWTRLPDESYLRVELRTRLRGALQSLPLIYRTPVLLRDIHGLSTEEASEELAIKTQTLKSRLHRGRLALRQQLADFGDGLSLHSAA